jgi:hypothetical protein
MKKSVLNRSANVAGGLVRRPTPLRSVANTLSGVSSAGRGMLV